MRFHLALGALLLLGEGAFAGNPTIVPGPNQVVPLATSFCNEEGNPVLLQSYFDGSKPMILVLAYFRCPRLCSLVLDELAESVRTMERDIGRDFDIITISIDPHETPERITARKKACVERAGRNRANSGWHFLTGDEPAIRRVADSVGYGFQFDPATNQYAHASGIMILTPQGKVARNFMGVQYPPRELDQAVRDAKESRTAETGNQVLSMLCFSFDPSTGKYTLASLRLVRLTGIVAVLAMVFFGWRLRREAQL